MKLTASLIGNVRDTVPTAVQKLAARLEPGQSVATVDGGYLRILQKNASPSGLHFRVAGIGGQQSLSLRQLASVGLVSPGMQRLASFVRSVLAAGMSLDSLVKEAIRAAGYPVDKTMDWTRYLTKMYKPMLSAVTKNEEMMDDAIHDVVIHALYEQRLLSPDSPYSHFDPNYEKLDADKPLDKKVSSYLQMLFGNLKREVLFTVKRLKGIGAQGEVGMAPAESLSQQVNQDEDSSTFGDLLPDENTTENEAYEGFDEITGFLDAFKQYITTSKRLTENTMKTLLFVTDCFERGVDRKEIRESLIDNPEFKSRSGNPLSRFDYVYVMDTWVNMMHEFATDPSSKWSGTQVARMLLHAIEKLRDKKKKKEPTTAALHLADVGTEEEQPQTPPAAATPSQNQNVLHNSVPAAPSIKNLNTAQPAATPAAPAQPAQPAQPVSQQPNSAPATPEQNNTQQPKRTIPPEIPGVNHVASEEPMKQEQKKEAADNLNTVNRLRLATRKYARLRRIAATEPQEVGAALGVLASTFNALGGSLQALATKLDLNMMPVAKGASVRERVAFRNKFAAELKRMANENPEAFAAELNDFYKKLEEVVDDIEVFAENLGVELAEAEPAAGEEAIETAPTPEDNVEAAPVEV